MLLTDAQALTPGAHLRAEIERLHLDQGAVAQATGVSRQTINNLVNDRQAISRAMAAKLGRLTGRSSDYWLRSLFPNPATKQELAEPNGERLLRGERPDHSAILVNYQIIRAVREGVICVDPFTQENVQRASIDLTLDDFIITPDGKEIDISEGQSFTLKAGQTANVRTREWIELPLDYVGRLGGITKLAKFGIIISHGFQVDPGFKGHLQFCLFNAGGRSFLLISGAPIISLEITPLARTPSVGEGGSGPESGADDRADVASHFRGQSSSSACDRLIRHTLGGYVKFAGNSDLVSARIAELDLDIVDSGKEAASAGAVASALDTLKVLRANQQTRTDLNDTYDAFFNGIADRLCLSADQVRSAIVALGLPFLDGDNSIVRLRNGESVVLQLPNRPAKITLRTLARQLRMNSHDLILLLTGAMPCAQLEIAPGIGYPLNSE
jgi:deoxycytidine triphosphate deaminase/addiction module HigA family antidote